MDKSTSQKGLCRIREEKIILSTERDGATHVLAAAAERNAALAPDAPLAPVTVERPVRTDLETSIPKPYHLSVDDVLVSFALLISDFTVNPFALLKCQIWREDWLQPEYGPPNGTPGHVHDNLSVLQQHCAFFDQDDNGNLDLIGNLFGLRQIGFNMVASLIIAIVINVGLSYPTLPSWIPSPFFPLYIRNIHKIKHGSDSGTFDTEGRYSPVNFENIFSKYGHTFPDKLTLRELWNLSEGNRVSFDFFGWLLNKGEWGLLYILARDEDGFLSKEAIRRCYDGSLFEYCARIRRGAQVKLE
ncbi:Peroxygenase [Sesamum angolense]|uniref:Peroxygenase n=1 Tax=Sesamum angolense TaxID=2727404 RepID=A0AAE2C1V4_9LAMI|nr:Peroxygenase [Sesamum angolense]